MNNMSYCRFENTVLSVQECIDALHENDWGLEVMIEEASSDNEARAMRRFVEMYKKVSEVFSDE